MKTKYPEWNWYGGFCANGISGGIMVGVGPRARKIVTSVIWTSIVGGRIGRLQLCVEDSSFSIFNFVVGFSVQTRYGSVPPYGSQDFIFGAWEFTW